jgi:hypothetical protein
MHKSFVGRTKNGRPTVRTVCGLLMHASLVVTLEGLPLGLAAVKFWTRKKFKSKKGTFWFSARGSSPSQKQNVPLFSPSIIRRYEKCWTTLAG